jgi:hypothetical protein
MRGLRIGSMPVRLCGERIGRHRRPLRRCFAL